MSIQVGHKAGVNRLDSLDLPRQRSDRELSVAQREVVGVHGLDRAQVVWTMGRVFLAVRSAVRSGVLPSARLQATGVKNSLPQV
jgi:hypothetical protein